jgi:hypothetical protein
MRNQIKAIKRRHDNDHHSFDVDLVKIDPDLMGFDDVSYQQWLFVHEDRKVLLDEIDRLYKLLRRRRRAV